MITAGTKRRYPGCDEEDYDVGTGSIEVNEVPKKKAKKHAVS